VNEDDIRKMIRAEMEAFIEEHHWPEKEFQEALLEVAKDHLWKKGLMVKLKYWANVIMVLGVIGGAITIILGFFGYEVLRK